MESFRFMAGMGMDAAMEAISSTQEAAKERMERMSSDVASSMSRIRDSASDMASMDLSKIELGVSLETLKESAKNTGAVVMSSGWQSGRQSGDERPADASGGQPAASGVGNSSRGAEDGSDSGGEDAAKANSSMFGAMLAPSFASRLGLQQQSSTEKEQLVPKRSSSEGGALARMSGSIGGSFTNGFSTLGGSFRESMSGSGLLGTSAPKEPDGLVGRACQCCPTLTYQQRMLGFIICFILGGILSLSALSSLPGLLIGNPAPFAFKYTAGNLLSIGSSSFLVGPAKQCRDMAAPERSTASLVYILTLAGTLWSIFFLKVQMLTFLFVVMQMCSLTWYMLSYVPYGQQCVRRLIRRFTS